MQVNDFGIAIFYVTSAIAGAAGVIGYFRANLSKATIDLYKTDNEALRLRIETLEQMHVEDQAKIKSLEESHQNLIQIVTQAEAIKQLRAQVDQVAQTTYRIAEKVGA